MKVNQLRCLPLLIPICLCGCVTPALWQNGYLERFNEPASNPNLCLYAAPKESDVLVTYDEYCERRDRVRMRAYWLNRNERRIERQQPPEFEDPKLARELETVPVFSARDLPISDPPALYAISMNNRSFTLWLNDGTSTDHMLPFYNDGTGRMRKLFYTPAAVAADATLVGGFVGYMYLRGRADRSEWER
jgi:hypothetical protein